MEYREVKFNPKDTTDVQHRIEMAVTGGRGYEGVSTPYLSLSLLNRVLFMKHDYSEKD